MHLSAAAATAAALHRRRRSVLWAATADSTDVHGNWQVVQDTTAAGGTALANPDFAQGKITPALADSVNEFEMTFSAVANTPTTCGSGCVPRATA